MTRQELKVKKAREEIEFIKSLDGQVINAKQKNKFRTTSVWKGLREKFKGGIDPITLRKLPKRFALHHMNLNPRFYTDLNPNNFRGLNASTHDILHYLYGYYRKDPEILTRLKEQLDFMVELNDHKDICDFKKD